jgi:tetratricopeptide (TPR) repeat protein
VKKILSMLIFLVIGAFLTQGFQCASPEMTSAKIAMGTKPPDFQKAKNLLEKELAKNPQNDEALIDLVNCKKELKDYLGAVSTLVDGEKIIKTPEVKKQVPSVKRDLWVGCYQQGLNYYSNYYNKNEKEKKEYLYQNKKAIDTALIYLETATLVRATQPLIYNMIGVCYEIKENMPKAVEAYQKYYELLKNDIEFAKSKGIYVGLKREEAISKFGKDNVESKGNKNCPDCDSTVNDEIAYGNKVVYLFSGQAKDKPMSVRGWRYNIPKDWYKDESKIAVDIQIEPILSIARYYYEKKDLEKAKEYLKIVLTLEPTNEVANSSLVGIYEDSGNKEEALKYISDLVSKNPKNATFISQYADMLQQIEKYDESIIQYEKALAIEPNMETATRNLAAAYKNKVYIIQKAQQDSLIKNPKYRPDKKEYESYLEKSAGNFEKALKLERYRIDFEVMAELFEIYFVIDNKDKQNQLLSKVTSMENTIPEEKKEKYYTVLVKMLDRTGNKEALQQAQGKLEKYIKK